MEVFLGTKQRDGTMVSIQEKDRRKHMAIFGKSGVGKTTLMRNMVVADLNAGNGLTVIDPHGSLIDDILDVIPRHRTNDVIYLNPGDPSRILGLNVLESVDPSQRSLVVSSLISIMRNLWPANGGPRTEYILEHAVYALLKRPEPVTLAALPKLLLDRNYRKQIVRNVTDPAVLCAPRRRLRRSASGWRGLRRSTPGRRSHEGHQRFRTGMVSPALK